MTKTNRRTLASLLRAISISLLPLSAFAQPAPPIPWLAPNPETEKVQLAPIGSDHDSQIVRDAIVRNKTRFDRDIGFERRIDPGQVLIGRVQIAPGSEAQIVFLLIAEDECDKWGDCRGYALDRDGNEWVVLTDLRGDRSGRVDLATKPIEARQFNPANAKYDIAIVVQPTNGGRRTIVWSEVGYFWNGAKWGLFCWSHECD